ncbi:MAG: hypothetical protein V4714_07005 [Bacteroidota bacterium]
MKKALLFIFGITFLFPSFERYTHAYQSSLWTYDNHRRYQDKSYDLQFRIGPEIEVIQPWLRVRLGFPIKPLTVDIQAQARIIQVRLDTFYIVYNLITAMVGLLLVWAWKWNGKRGKTGASTMPPTRQPSD